MARSSSRRNRDKTSSSRSRSVSRSSSSSSATSASSSVSSSSSPSESSRSSSPSKSSHSSRSPSKRPASPEPASKVHVNRLTKNVNKNHITEIFKSYGPIKNVDLPLDRNHPQLGRGTAFIEFEKAEDAEKAIRYMDGGQIDGQEITVSKVNNSPTARIGGPNRGDSRRKFSPRR